jgi:hypothetical protein
MQRNTGPGLPAQEKSFSIITLVNCDHLIIDRERYLWDTVVVFYNQANLFFYPASSDEILCLGADLSTEYYRQNT